MNLETTPLPEPLQDGAQVSPIVIVDLINNLLAPMTTHSPIVPKQMLFLETGSSNNNNKETSMLNGPRGSFVVSDLLTSILALIGNSLILSALVRTKFSLGGYRRFLLSLLAADIFMAATAMLAVFHQYFTSSSSPASVQAFERCGNVLLRSLTLVSYFASLLSIAGLTVDNFIGIFFELRYRHLMTGERLKWAVICLWLLSFLLGFADTLVALANYLYVVVLLKKSLHMAKSPWNRLDEQQADAEDDDFNIDDIFSTSSARPDVEEIQFIRHDSYENNDSGSIKIAKQAESSHDLQLRNLITDVLELVETQRKEDHFCGMLGAEKFGVEFFVIGVTIPCFILVLVIYCCIFIKVMRRQQIGEGGPGSSLTRSLLPITPAPSATPHQPILSRISSPPVITVNNLLILQPNRNNVRLVLTTLMLISSFAFCWMSFVTFELFVFVRSRFEQTADNDTPTSGAPFRTMDKNETLLTINSVFNSLLMLSPLINPIIYAVRLPRVRDQLVKILTCNFGRSGNYGIHRLISSTVRSSPLLMQHQPSSRQPSSLVPQKRLS